ncbi:heme biosynthesis protein HemY [soil metagenome]
MRRFIILLLILIGAVWLGIQINKDPGYVLLAYHQWTIELPLWFAFIVFVLTTLLVYVMLRLIHQAGSLSWRIHEWSQQRRLRRSRLRTNRGLLDLAEGNWANAERNLLRAVNNSETPLLNYLSAAKAAQKQGAYQRRDDYLHQAHDINPEAEMAVGLTQAQLQIEQHQYELALATLRHLRELMPQNPQILKLLKDIYIPLRDWRSLLELLPELRKRKVINSQEYIELQQQSYQGLLSTEIVAGTTDIIATWQQIPRELQRHPTLIQIYGRYLLAKGETATAETIIADALKRSWDGPLASLYGLAIGNDAAKQLTTAEAWLKQHPKDPALLLTLGRLCTHNKLWGKARDYFTLSTEFAPAAETYRELGKLLEQLGDKQAAANAYKKGLERV